MFKFTHEEPVKADCCNYRVSTTYWMAVSREDAEKEITAKTGESREPHGLCSDCMIDLLKSDKYEIKKTG